MTACSGKQTPATVPTCAWTEAPVAVTETAATIEVDVMPFLGRTKYGGPFDAYFETLSALKADRVRFAPWYPNPRVVVTELAAPDCTAEKPATNFNSTLFDGVMRDILAVCGPGAPDGDCTHSVVQQISTMPGWLYDKATPIAPPERPSTRGTQPTRSITTTTKRRSCSIRVV